ncbi:MAG: sigma-70 family RNA polymerase sigma factor [Kiritimatiellales bacterium]|nr:sigma-70 family RNA polymerase sigma factor [Kiritimatiellales bacterium]
MKIRSSSESIEEDFAQAYEEYADAIFRHCAFRVFDRDLGKELMQDAFMKTWEYIAKGNDIDNVRAFLYKTANNLVINYIRRKNLRKVVSLEDMQESGFDIEGASGKEIKESIDAKAVLSVLGTIKEPHRSLLVMRYIDELKPVEIASLIGGTANAISVKLNRAVKYLRSSMPHE